ncbi:MAG: hypothetical protein PHT88_03280 [Candidatus Moranbacteria bacterium]|nr:hypothetical protein [Candidatus Moranbacteria bacterium]
MKTLLFILLGVFCLSAPAQADVFELHFSYDAKQNTLNFTDNQDAVTVNKEKDISIVEFSKSPSSGDFEFAFIDATGFEIERKNFTPKAGNFVVETPYYSIATKLIVRKIGVAEPILTRDISALSTCNNNKICEFEKGETINTCLPDCGSSNVTYSAETKTKLESSNNIVRDEKTGSILLNNVKVAAPQPEAQLQTPQPTAGMSATMVAILSAIALLVLGGIGYFVYKKW